MALQRHCKPLAWALGLAATALPQLAGAREQVRPLIIDLAPARTGPAFDPAQAIGAGIDGAHKGEIDRLFTRHNIAEMKSAGLRALTYRLRTELGIETWHWNPAGTWSDPAHAQGYWTSSDQPGAPIQLSWGYRLPRRGDTLDNANDEGWSRLTDGDQATFWKSNPYLDPAALGDGQAHPQWLMLHFRRKVAIDRAVIDWGTPWAADYEVQYWSGADDYNPDGRWIAFPHGTVTGGAGGRAELVLADRPIVTEHVRVMLAKASGTALPGANGGTGDWRDRAGFAVREVSFGTADAGGAFHDVVIHAPSHRRQTIAHVSSTDPWHRAEDRDPDLEQAGLDRVFASGLSFGQPVMVPTGLLYDTPENEAAELRYIRARGWRVTQIELGEEPDGQYAPPADYAALYLKAADNLRGILPGAAFGGPSQQSAFTVTELLPETPGYWAKWFVDYLRQRGRLGDLGFFSFEFYPFDNICGDIPAKLVRQSRMLDAVNAVLDRSGVPRGVPRIISEYGFSAFSGRAEDDLPDALLTNGIVGQWLSTGGNAAYLFGYGPNRPEAPEQACAGYGNMMPFMADGRGQATVPTAAFHAARMLSGLWTQPGGGLHRVIPATIAGEPGRTVSAYGLRRPDGSIAVMVINRSVRRGFALPVLVEAGGGRIAARGPAQVWRFGPGEYRWLDAGAQSRPLRSRAAVRLPRAGGPLVLKAAPQTIVVAIISGRRAR